MITDDDADELRRSVRRAARRHKKAERERPTVLAETAYLGTLGLLIALPIVAGAYLGAWLDERVRGYSVSWTVTCLVLGVAVGALNVYLFVKERS